ncbi:MAG: hypothetical protein NC307_05180 [Roseburia sp.]|nr:hypothetical protein [Roseburia sp.]
MTVNRKIRMEKEIKIFFGIVAMMLMVVLENTTVSAADRNFNKTSTISISDAEAHYVSGKYTWIKYKAPKNGYITITAQFGSRKYNVSQGYWRLYASNKKTALSESNKNQLSYSVGVGNTGSKYARQSIFGVKKGTTYYLRVQAYDGVKISCKFKEVKEKCAKKRSKAPILKKNKTVTGLIFPKDKNKDWYKIQIKKAQYIQLFYDIKTDGKFKISICSIIGSKLQSGKFGYTSSTRRLMIKQHNSVTNKNSKMNAGTYYIKVEPVDKYSSGYYKLKWK